MKMETAVRAPVTGRVREVLAVVNAQVDAGAALLRVDPAGDDGEEVVGERVDAARGRRRPGRRRREQGPGRARARCRR